MFGCVWWAAGNLLVRQEFQNKESMRFLALFDRTMVVHLGHRHDTAPGDGGASQRPRLYHAEMWEPTTYCRFLEVRCTPERFCSGGCFLLKVPPSQHGAGGVAEGVEPSGGRGTVYKWIGPDAPAALVHVVERLDVASLFPGCTEASPPVCCPGAAGAENADADDVQLPLPFAAALGLGATRMLGVLPVGPRALRVFLCHVTQGTFTVTEKIPQVYQDDLREDVAAIVSNFGRTTAFSSAGGVACQPFWRVYLWVGRLVSDPVFKLASAAAATYARVGVRNAEAGVAVEHVQQGHEPLAFTQLFHGWGRSIDRYRDTRVCVCDRYV